MIRTVLRLSVIALVVPSGCADHPLPIRDASALAVFSLDAEGTIFRLDGSILFVGQDAASAPGGVRWSRRAARADVAHYYPTGFTGGAYGVVKCSVAGKHLVGCKSQYPTTPGYEAAFEGLAAEFWLGAGAPSADRIDYIVVEMRLSDGGEWRPCPGAPFCVVHKGPPPPPPDKPAE